MTPPSSSSSDAGSPKTSSSDAEPPQRIDRPVVLVGMMGVGKTTIGRRLAPRLGLPFKDADEEIVAAAGMSISELFAEHGEAHFRRGEAQIIERLLNGPPIVLATGGGALTTEATRLAVKERAISIWLRADISILVERATRRNVRPLLQNGDPKEIITHLLKEREPHYAAADIIVDSRAGPHQETVDKIVEKIALLPPAPQPASTSQEDRP